jgi:hypothetical protein
MKQDSGQFFSELKKDVVTYAELKLELLKLGTYERTGKVIAVLSYGIILVILGFFLLLFIFLALGFFLSDRFDSLSAGFSVVAVLYFLLIGGVVLFKKQIRNRILNLVIATLVANDKKHEATDETNSAGTTVC